MTNQASDYATLPVEDTWVRYLRTRLPYSFGRVEEKQGPGSRKVYELYSPVMVNDAPFGSRYHNFWKRGYVFYVMGKVVDYGGLSALAGDVGRHIENPLWSRFFGPAVPLVHGSGHDVWNALQVAEMAERVRNSTLERERVAMTNVLFAVELCLKSVLAHANYREHGKFTFGFTHDLRRLYEALPESLRAEMSEESVRFVESYFMYRDQATSGISEVVRGHGDVLPDLGAWDLVRQRWLILINQMQASPYTVFVNHPDPLVSLGEDDWFPRALDYLGSIGGMAGGTYFRYAPFNDTDDLPVDALHYLLALGRFLYEHLFPPSSQ